MATSATALSSAGVQELYNKGLLPTNLSTNTLNKATSTQISQLANSSIASQEASALLGSSSASSSSSNSDTVSLSSNATAALNEAVANQLTLNGTTAANQFLGTSSNNNETPTTGTNINVVG